MGIGIDILKAFLHELGIPKLFRSKDGTAWWV